MKVLESSASKVTVEFAEGKVIDFLLGGSEHDLAPLFSGSFWSAMIWQQSVDLMCTYIAQNPVQFANKTVVELGCGLGVPGFTSGYVANAKNVLLTDREDDLVQLRRTMEHNNNIVDGEKFHAVAFDWCSNAEIPQIDHQADIILAIECISADAYGRESLDGLVRAIHRVAKKTPSCVVFVCSCRRESTDGLDEVLAMLGTKKNVELVQREGKAELYKIEL